MNCIESTVASHLHISKIHSVSFPRSKRLNYFQIFLYFSVTPIQFVWVFVLTISLFRNPSSASVKLPFATAISRFDLLSYNNLWCNEAHPLCFRIFSSPRSVLARSASHQLLAPPCSFPHTYLTLWPITPGILLPPPFILPSFFSYRLPGLLPDETNWSKLRDSARFHLQFCKFRVFGVRFVGILQFPSRLRPYEPFGKQLPVILASVVFFFFYYFPCKMY